MARADVAELYAHLVESDFDFLPRGEHIVDYVYLKVREQFPHLCDDAYRCYMNCQNGHDQPEWQHAVRKALQQRKNLEFVHKSDKRGYWRFI